MAFYNNKLCTYWEQACLFHGHSCPGLAIGCRMTFESMQLLAIEHTSVDEELCCVAETDACGIDAIQSMLSCTMGKGNLLLKIRGKNAFTFFQQDKQKGVRLVWKYQFPLEKNHAEKMESIFTIPSNDLFTTHHIQSLTLPKALISPSVVCHQCGELVAENMVRLCQSQPVCFDCYPNYSRVLL